MKKFLFAIACMALTVSCNEDSTAEYSGGSYIQFNIPEQTGDTLSTFTFAYVSSTVNKDTISLHILAVGPASSQDRHFAIRQVQVDSVTNAIPDEDYLSFDSEEMRQACVIKAGEVTCDLPVVIYRSNDRSRHNVLRIEVAANDEFQLGDSRYLHHVIEFTSGLQRPRQWKGYQIDYYYGKYSQTKHQWMIDVSGKRWDDDYIDNITTDEFKYWISTFKRKLKEINAERAAQGLGPWCDEDGDEIAFGMYF